MKRLYYASGSVVLGDQTAHAILAYSQALSSRVASATLDVPVLGPNGQPARAQLLIGPASQMLVVPEEVDGEFPELDDESVLRVIGQRVEGLLSPEAQPIPFEHIQDHSDLQ